MSALDNKTSVELYDALKFFKDNQMDSYMFMYLCKIIHLNKIFSFDLAKCYLYGNGTEVDYRLASYYFNISKKCGDKHYFKYLILVNILLDQPNDVITTIKEHFNYKKLNKRSLIIILKNISERFYNTQDKYFSIIIDKYIDNL